MPDRINDNTDIYQVDAVAGLLRDCAYAASTVFHGHCTFRFVGGTRTVNYLFFATARPTMSWEWK